MLSVLDHCSYAEVEDAAVIDTLVFRGAQELEETMSHFKQKASEINSRET